ncbi:hypothetical protein Theco_3430 [Thermobacillus composti KWC4]|uniref:Uncharacterized protein n=1 Tax=Thermobacillus composti (strain DSM 18247 / JCM 13945 / KWC4) TaxID=717605 RepID=L0EIF5_THECK|nr:hypothetical protein Theco_3430 [Thermobacillus composti KWC4]
MDPEICTDLKAAGGNGSQKERVCSSGPPPFFYTHAGFVVLSLVPASFRAVQMWRELNTPMWMEIVVELSRVVLLALILARLEKLPVRLLLRKAFWNDFRTRCAAYLGRHWPHVLLAQIAGFLLLVYGLMNGLIAVIVNEGTVRMAAEMAGFGHDKREAASNAMVYFLKNMSVIPMTMVYLARMIGFGDERVNA